LFGFGGLVLDNPKTQTVFHSFPKLSAALQKKFGTDAAYRASRRNVFRLTSREGITITTFAESRSGSSLRVAHRTWTTPGAMRRRFGGRS
jgi:hypothetical protein